jgi:16S rRNA (adenine1518-N6/adenine1519-N6)-dimethyltransferase
VSVQRLLRDYGLRPRQRLGQRFLADEGVLERIVAAAEIVPADTVLEVGPGLGTLTRALAKRAGRVIAVELDDHLVAILHQRLSDCPNVTIVQGDILQLAPAELVGPHTPYLVVANLPYYITSPVLRHFLEATRPPERLVLMLQKEVAQRLLATPGQMSLLAVSVQFYARPRLVGYAPASAFYPRPQVDSAIVRLDIYDQPPVPVDDVPRFFRVVAAGFSQPRKQLKNALAHALGLPLATVVEALTAAEIAPQQRAESLSLSDWARLAPRLQVGGRAGAL